MAINKLAKLGTIKVDRKKPGFTMIDNFPVQVDLAGPLEIGILTYLLSLPDDWQIHKTHVQKRFTRRTFDTGWKALIEKRYAMEVSFFADGYKGKIYLYSVSDKKYTQEDLNSFVKNADDQLKAQGIIMNQETFKCAGNFDIPDFISIAQNVQYKMDCTNSATTKKHKQRNINKDKELTKIVNKELPNSENQDLKESQNLKESKQGLQENDMQEVPVTNKQETTNDIKNDFLNICNSFYLEFSVTRWTKKEWNTIIDKYVSEIMETERYREIKYRKNYVYSSLLKMVNHHEIKNETTEERESRVDAILQGLF